MIMIRHDSRTSEWTPEEIVFHSHEGTGTLHSHLKNFDERLRRNVVGFNAQLLEGFVVFECAGEVGRGKVSHGAV